MEMEKDKVVLAYSGGLDTSVCIKWLMEEKGLDVIAVTGDVGQERQDLEFVKNKALQVGAIEALAIDMREEYVNDFLTKALAANCMYENKYPMVSALSRPVISKNRYRAQVRCEVHRPWVHGQGKRPGSFRGCHPEPRSRDQGARSRARVGSAHA